MASPWAELFAWLTVIGGLTVLLLVVVPALNKLWDWIGRRFSK